MGGGGRKSLKGIRPVCKGAIGQVANAIGQVGCSLRGEKAELVRGGTARGDMKNRPMPFGKLAEQFCLAHPPSSPHNRQPALRTALPPRLKPLEFLLPIHEHLVQA